MTGAPSERIELHAEEMSKFAAAQAAKLSGGDAVQQRELLWATILSFRQSRFLMGVSCGRRDASPEVYEAVGLLPDHAYALLDARLMDNGLHLVQLRNPWGSHSWRGDWSATSPLWTPQMRKALNYHPTHAAAATTNTSAATGFFQQFNPIKSSSSSSSSSIDHDASIGTFWMSFGDFLAYFRTIDVCKFQDDWHVMRLRDEFALTLPNQQQQQQGGQRLAATMLGQQQQSPQQAFPNHCDWTSRYMYELTIPASTWCFVSIIQQDLRGTNAPRPHAYRSVGSVTGAQERTHVDACPCASG